MARKNWHSLPEYQAFRALMETGTASAAAAHLSLSQPAVSRSIANLEARTGYILFERDGGRLRPTAEALQLNRRLDPLFDALARIDGPIEPVRETLTLIAPPSYTHRYLVDICASFMRAKPDYNLRILVATNDDMPRYVLEHSCDLALVGVDMTRSGLKTIPFRRSPAVCALPSDHPLAAKEQIEPTDLRDENLISLTQNNITRGTFDRIMAQAGVYKPPVMEADTWQFAADMVKAGAGVSILNPFPSALYPDDRIVYRRFNAPIHFTTTFFSSEDRPLSHVGRAFLRHVRLTTPQDGFSEAL